LPGDGWLDGKGDPFTDALTLTERFRRVNFEQLQINVDRRSEGLHAPIHRQSRAGARG